MARSRREDLIGEAVSLEWNIKSQAKNATNSVILPQSSFLILEMLELPRQRAISGAAGQLV